MARWASCLLFVVPLILTMTHTVEGFYQICLWLGKLNGLKLLHGYVVKNGLNADTEYSDYTNLSVQTYYAPPYSRSPKGEVDIFPSRGSLPHL